MNKNYEYFMKSDLNRYAGNWVIILKEKVVASGTGNEIKNKMKKLKKDNPNEIPFVAKIPDKVLQIV